MVARIGTEKRDTIDADSSSSDVARGSARVCVPRDSKELIPTTISWVNVSAEYSAPEFIRTSFLWDWKKRYCPVSSFETRGKNLLEAAATAFSFVLTKLAR